LFTKTILQTDSVERGDAGKKNRNMNEFEKDTPNFNFTEEKR
jgi:hypothetical protein